jgi:hypothetical protein
VFQTTGCMGIQSFNFPPKVSNTGKKKMPADSIVVGIQKCLEDCQKSFASHRKCAVRMRKLQACESSVFREVCSRPSKLVLASSTPSYFWLSPQELLMHIDRILVVQKREPSVERLVSFFGEMCFPSAKNSAEEVDVDLLLCIIAHLLDLLTAKNKTVRFRSCQLLARILSQCSAYNISFKFVVVHHSFKPYRFFL